MRNPCAAAIAIGVQTKAIIIHGCKDDAIAGCPARNERAIDHQLTWLFVRTIGAKLDHYSWLNFERYACVNNDCTGDRVDVARGPNRVDADVGDHRHNVAGCR